MPRSTAITGTPRLLASITAGTTASESVALTISTSTPRCSRSSMFEIWLLTLSWASVTMSSKPSSSAACWAPSRTSTKKGLLSVESDRPMVCAKPALTSAATMTRASFLMRSSVWSGPAGEARARLGASRSPVGPAWRAASAPRRRMVTPRAMRWSRARLASLHRGRSALAPREGAVEQERRQDHTPLHDLLVEARDVQQVHAVVDDTDDQGADERAPHPAAPAGERGAAHHH